MNPPNKVYFAVAPPADFYPSLGEFITLFAGVEEALFYLLRATVEMSHREACAIFSGEKVDVIIEKVRRFRQARGVDEHPTLKDTFDHLKAIANVRNDLLHYGFAASMEDPSQYVATNASRHTKPRVALISAEILKAMSHDLLGITQRLVLFAQVKPEYPNGLIDGLEPGVLTPWLYTRE